MRWSDDTGRSEVLPAIRREIQIDGVVQLASAERSGFELLFGNYIESLSSMDRCTLVVIDIDVFEYNDSNRNEFLSCLSDVAMSNNRKQCGV